MSDEQDKQQPAPDLPEEAEKPDTVGPEQPTEPEEEEHSLKESARETVGWVVGRAVEIGSLLGGEGGDIVEAQRKVAEADTEELIDKIDGED